VAEFDKLLINKHEIIDSLYYHVVLPLYNINHDNLSLTNNILDDEFDVEKMYILYYRLAYKIFDNRGENVFYDPITKTVYDHTYTPVDNQTLYLRTFYFKIKANHWFIPYVLIVLDNFANMNGIDRVFPTHREIPRLTRAYNSADNNFKTIMHNRSAFYEPNLRRILTKK